MKLRILSICYILMLINLPIYGSEKKILQDDNGQFIEAVFNDFGIIESLKGTVSNYYPDDGLSCKLNDDVVFIQKSMSGDDCYNIEIQIHDTYLTLTKIFTQYDDTLSRDNIKYNIYFDKNDEYFVKDNFIEIGKDKTKSKVVTSSADSYLPLLQYYKNICIQYFGKVISEGSAGSRKYEYSEDKKTVFCYKIIPGDKWLKYMTATIFDFKSDNKAVNLINYIILYNYDNQLGVMFFPILFDLDESSSDYIDIEIDADSYLTEGSVKYLPENLKNTALGTPWVEGKSGDGIGSKIILKGKRKISKLVISNGFDSIKKYIFDNNNRVRKIRITDLENQNNYLYVELPDTVEPYEIRLPFTSKLIEIEILSVYKGIKYEDTCLNYILAK